MTNLDINKLIELLEKDRERVLHVLLEMFEKVDGRLKVSNELLTALFIDSDVIVENDEKIEVQKLRVDWLTLELYMYFDFSKFTYSNLMVNYTNRNDDSLSIMKNNGIKFYTDKIFNKNCSDQNFNGIYIDGNFDGWDIKGASFKGCLGKPVIHPQLLLNKSLYEVKLADAYVSGNCDDVIVESASFKDAHIDMDNFRFTPQKVKNASLKNTILSGVPIYGNLDDVYIFGTDFTGYIGEVIFNCDRCMLSKLQRNVFAGVYFSGDFSEEVELIKNNFTGAINAIIDCSTINTKYSKNNIFSGVTFRNLSMSDPHFCNLDCHIASTGFAWNDNNFNNSILFYNACNKKDELKYYKKVCRSAKAKRGFKKMKLVNEDLELENEIKGIVVPEMELQKIKAKTEKNS